MNKESLMDTKQKLLQKYNRHTVTIILGLFYALTYLRVTVASNNILANLALHLTVTLTINFSIPA